MRHHTKIQHMNQEIVLDTDIGDDIDDALALAVVLNSPELKLRGVTTVFRNAPRRARLAQHLLEVFGRSEIPVVPGCSKPLLQPFERLHGGAQLGSQFEVLEEDTWSGTGHAVDFLIEAARVDEEPELENPLTIVPIGPLTNIAVALAREPELIPRVRIVLMGGQWSAERAEWNISCDPEAAAIVFNSGVEVAMVGLDVTLRCRLNEVHLQRIAQRNTPQTELLTRLIHLWQRDNHHPVTLHDPLAVLSLFDDCVTWEEKRIEVALCGVERGKTLIVEGPANTGVAVDVDVARAIDLFENRVLG
jgi:purine nucleosidase